MNTWVILAAVGLCCELGPPSDLPSATVVIASPTFPSGCRYFQSLSEALEAPALPSLHIYILPIPAGVELTGETTVTGEVEIYGSDSLLVVSGEVTIQGNATIVEARIKISKDIDIPVFTVTGGTLTLRDVTVAGEKRNFIQLSNGNVSMFGCEFQGLGNPLLTLRSAEFQLLVDQVLINNCSNFIEINFMTNGLGGFGQLAGVIMKRSSRFLWYRNGTFGYLRFHINNSTFSQSDQDLVSGAVENLRMEVENITFQSIQGFFDGSIYNSTILIRNSTVIQCYKHFINLSSLSGAVFIESTQFTEVIGPIVLLPVNPYSAPAAMISFQSCSFSQLQNVNSSGALFCCSSVAMFAKNVELRDSYIYASGLFRIVAGVVELSQINYHDCSGQLAIIYEAVATEVQMFDSSLTRLTHDIGYCASCISSSHCQWRNLTVTEFFDPNPPVLLLYVWAGYGGTVTVQHSYFRSTAAKSFLTLGAAYGGKLSISDCVFEDLWNNQTFGAFTESIVSITNITLIRPRLDVLFTAEFQANLTVSGVSVTGKSDIATLLHANSGNAVIQNAVFDAISATVIRATNAHLTFTNLSITNISGVICRNCENSVITMQFLLLEHVQSSVAVQLSFSTCIWSNAIIRNVTCQQFIMLDSSQLTVTDAVFGDMQLDSSGGLVDAMSSIITIDSSRFHKLLSSISLHLGFLYLEGSSIEVRNSSFTDFNCTLVHSVRSALVSISDSHFSAGIHQSFQHPRNVKLRGSVLYSELTAVVSIAKSTFTNLTADSGGVVYLIGSGTEICSLDNSAAGDNSAQSTGGFLYSSGYSVNIHNCDFVNNTAVEGGALALFGDSHSTVTHCFFANNKAQLAGGAITYRQNNTGFVHCEWSNNTALYGPDIASEVSSLSVLDKDSHGIISNYSVDAVSGQTLQSEIVIGCMDNVGQIVFTDEGSTLSLFTLEANSSVIASNLLESSSGMYRIPSLTVIGAPESTLSIYGTHGRKLTVLLLTVRLRECVAGEYQSALQCKPCSHNTYSFSPRQPCTLCPDQADCPGGAVMSLHRGYWRQHNATNEIFQCIVADLCAGGDSSGCAPGHTGPMCSACASGYFKMNQQQCMSCVNEYIPVLRAVLAAVAFLGVLLIAYRRRAVLTAVAVFDYLQSLWITTHFNLFWPEAIAHFSAVAGDLGSLGLTTATSSCVGTFGRIPAVYSQLIVLAIHMVMTGVVLGAVSYCILSRVRKITMKRFLRLLFYAYFLVLPIAFHRGIQLLPFFDISGKRYLVFDSSIESRTATHLAIAAVSSVSLGLCIFALVSYLCFTGTRRTLALVPQWKARSLLVLLLRKLALSALVVPANSLSLYTQAGVTIAVNISAETIVYRLSPPNHAFLQFYQLCLTVSTALSFFIAVYFASDASRVEWVFPLIWYLAQLPPLVHLGLVLRARPQVSPPLQQVETADMRSIVLEETGALAPNLSEMSLQCRERGSGE